MLRKNSRTACALLLGALSILGQVSCESRLLTLGHLAAAANGGSPAGGASQGGASASQSGSSQGGSSAPEEPLFEAVEVVTELAAELDADNDENPTLSSNQLELYFSSTRVVDGTLGAEDVWVARRSNTNTEFNAPVLVTTVNTENPDSSPSISLDGQTLWLGVERDGGLGLRDIWRFTRTKADPIEFGNPVLEANINSTDDDIPRPVGHNGLAMPLTSRRNSDYYVTYLATRSSTTSDFGAPTIIEELLLDGNKTADAFLTIDGLDLYFVRGVDDLTGDIYVAHRDTVTTPFGEPVALSTLNTENDERDPWLSPDGNTLYFVSDRAVPGTRRIYRATRVVP